MMAKEFRIKRSDPAQQLEERKALFDALNFYVRSRGGWVTSVAGRFEMTVECLPDGSLPGDLRGLGYTLRADGEGQRILPHGIVQQFTRRADGELEPVTAESTARIAETRTHAGITKVKRYSFDIP
jgi:hypothetical protein